ncbi:MAG: FAD-binding oxidoreductase [Pseudomonadota bacterium]
MKARERVAGWGNVIASEDAVVYRPERFASAKQIIEECADKTYLPVGNLRSYGDVCVNGSGAHVRMRRLNRILNFDKETKIVTVEAGLTMSELSDFAISKKCLPPVVPGTGFCTVGGAIGNDIHGKNHENSGTFTDHVVAFDLLTADGKVQTVTPESDPKLFYATAGGLGLTGVILSVSLKLKKAESGTLKVKRQQMPNLTALMDGLSQIKDDYSVAWIDALADGQSLGRGVLETAHSVGIEVPYDAPEPTSVPFYMPSFLLNKYSVKLFNYFYYNRAEACDRETFEDYRRFCFPLDAIKHWNRLYGKKGFYQFQCVLPEETAEKTLRAILKRCSKSGAASFLAVLKKFGAEGKGMLSFPRPGFTLALDFPNKKGVVAMLKEFEAMTIAAGGRVYLAKDALMSPESFEKMYPHKNEFLEVVSRVNPEALFTSNAAKRLRLNVK